jgi:hypothetical protein
MKILITTLGLLLPPLVFADLPSGPMPEMVYQAPTALGHYYAYYKATNWCTPSYCDQSAATVFAQGIEYCGVAGHLADLTNSAEKDDVYNNLVIPYHTKVASDIHAWLGLKYDTSAGQFKGSDGTMAKYVFFPGQDLKNPPNDPRSNSCVMIYGGSPLWWYNEQCTTQGVFGIGIDVLVEFDCGSTRAPVSAAPVTKAPISNAPVSKAHSVPPLFPWLLSARIQ